MSSSSWEWTRRNMVSFFPWASTRKRSLRYGKLLESLWKSIRNTSTKITFWTSSPMTKEKLITCVTSGPISRLALLTFGDLTLTKPTSITLTVPVVFSTSVGATHLFILLQHLYSWTKVSCISLRELGIITLFSFLVRLRKVSGFKISACVILQRIKPGLIPISALRSSSRLRN